MLYYDPFANIQPYKAKIMAFGGGGDVVRTHKVLAKKRKRFMKHLLKFRLTLSRTSGSHFQKIVLLLIGVQPGGCIRFFKGRFFPLLKNLGTKVAHFVTVLEEGILFGPVVDLDIYVVSLAFETFRLPFFWKEILSPMIQNFLD